MEQLCDYPSSESFPENSTPSVPSESSPQPSAMAAVVEPSSRNVPSTDDSSPDQEQGSAKSKTKPKLEMAAALWSISKHRREVAERKAKDDETKRVREKQRLLNVQAFERDALLRENSMERHAEEEASANSDRVAAALESELTAFLEKQTAELEERQGTAVRAHSSSSMER